MTYGRIPLFPPGNGCGCERPPMWWDDVRCRPDCKPDRRPCGCSVQTVRVFNPCRPSEYADVELSVDSDGNLSVCVKRPNCAPCRERCR